MKSKKFKDLSNNRIVEVTDQFEDILILDNKSKIKVNQILDKSKFEEFVDPNSFLRNESLINAFAEQIKKIPLDDWDRRPPADEMGFNSSGLTPMSNEDVTLPYDPEVEKEELMRKAQSMYGQNKSLMQKQFDLVKNILGDEELDDIPNIVETTSVPTQQVPQEIIQKQIEKTNVMDPILEMFKNVKRNTNFKIDFTVENKIPRIDFIEMMEDSYNTSIIDFLAQEFTDDILRDPSIIKEKIKKKLMDLVYPDVENLRKNDD